MGLKLYHFSFMWFRFCVLCVWRFSWILEIWVAGALCYCQCWDRFSTHMLQVLVRILFLAHGVYENTCGKFSFVCFWRNSPQGARASSFMRFLDHTQRHITDGRTPLDEWSAHRRDLYLKTHNTHNRQTSMSPVIFEPTISAGEQS